MPDADAAALRDVLTGDGEAMGDDGADAVARIRLCAIRLSNDSSHGREYSSRK